MSTTEELDGIVGGSEASVVGLYAQQALTPERVTPGEIVVIPTADGSRIEDTDSYALFPRRAAAFRTVTDAKSFANYVNRHATEFTEVYAHASTSTVVAVLDSHAGPALPGWQSHKLTLSLEHTKAWAAWSANNSTVERAKWFDQLEFAEFIEDRALDVIEPDHATLIEIATTFEAKKSADFTSAVRTQDGNVKFEYAETTTAKAGQKGAMQIPQRIQLALRPYIGGPIYSVWAAFRYRITPNGLRLGYALERPENILEAAFADIVTDIREGRVDKKDDVVNVVHEGIGEVPIFNGRP